ncbi:MAG: metalloregulator ArsR/SmtB family transcription factor [Candidatus Andeanibacterium colombiense]|uniref:Metalloregulator ArsR/SmtB family transcription factor n=1 Tax=Candidatus Andeanibacterium colombiense TaxID=3121345 RepID=A0AAJ5X928_9SPHN|nr:MAG: metalloregulator ArsR/SmtB family transcription factor [Sphingomonadaceae bacterium]
MRIFDILGDPVRRRILELLGTREMSAGELVEAIRGEFGISQPAVSQHLRVLREGGLSVVRAEAQRRLYTLRAEPLAEIEAWLAGFHTKPAKASDKKLRKEAKHGKKRKKHKAALAHLPKVPKRRKSKS